jgi:hypothetical protein
MRAEYEAGLCTSLRAPDVPKIRAEAKPRAPTVATKSREHLQKPKTFKRPTGNLAETACFGSTENRVVCGDWMAELVGLKLMTHHAVIETVSAIRVGNEIFRCRDGGSNSAFFVCRD